MPPFIDRVHLYEAVTAQAIPALEALAANGNESVLRRFERDEPPPYVSSTDSSLHEYVEPIPPSPGGRSIPDHLKPLMEQPITDEEISDMAWYMKNILHPRTFYYTEAKYEEARLSSRPRRGPRPPLFRHLNGSRREGVIMRHNVKRRWEKLGLWNPAWGFAGRKVQPGDDFRQWKWRWEPDRAKEDGAHVARDRRELVERALRLRQNLARGERIPLPPRSRLGPDAEAAQAEAFLISRPWFHFRLEIAEENARYDRLPAEDRWHYPHSAKAQVIRWWKERGD